MSEELHYCTDPTCNADVCNDLAHRVAGQEPSCVGDYACPTRSPADAGRSLSSREVMCSHPSEPHGVFHTEGECPHQSGRTPSWRTVTWAGEDFGVVDHALILNGNAWRTACATSRESGLWADGARTNPAEWGHREPTGDRPRCKLCAKRVSDA